MQSVVRIAYAFTKSDYKTIIGPVIFYALVSSPRLHLSTIPALVVWVWLHLLQACAANQMNGVAEDAQNKPYRPIPAGLISIETTRVLRWALVPVCLWLSWIFKVIYPGISLSLALIIYNELGLDSYWYTKNILNAIGIVSWNVGGALFPNPNVWLAPYLGTLLIASTIHVQDFRDEKGDRLQDKVSLRYYMVSLDPVLAFGH
ncbi:UbiA prenyltransferase family [Mycena floridula]|nr:UbiA prenyltransferase family [Mycena floridula]